MHSVQGQVKKLVQLPVLVRVLEALHFTPESKRQSAGSKRQASAVTTTHCTRQGKHTSLTLPDAPSCAGTLFIVQVCVWASCKCCTFRCIRWSGHIISLPEQSSALCLFLITASQQPPQPGGIQWQRKKKCMAVKPKPMATSLQDRKQHGAAASPWHFSSPLAPVYQHKARIFGIRLIVVVVYAKYSAASRPQTRLPVVTEVNAFVLQTHFVHTANTHVRSPKLFITHTKKSRELPHHFPYCFARLLHRFACGEAAAAVLR